MICVFHRTVILACFLLTVLSAISFADSPSPKVSQPRPSLREEQAARLFAQISLRKLSDAQLMQEYGDPGQLLSLAPYALLIRRSPFPGGDPNSSYDLKYLLFCDIKKEIIRRGAPMVSPLADFLEGVLPKERLAPTPPLSGIGRWYDAETIDLLAQIPSQSSAQALLNILAGDTGKAKYGQRYMAQSALEGLTYCCYYKNGLNPASIDEGASVPRLNADTSFPGLRYEGGYDKVADFYRQWLADEGKYPSQWLSLAQHRVRLLLATDDPIFINDAALFLTHTDYQNPPTMPHDDAPDLTLRRLGEIAAQVQQKGTDVIYDDVTRPRYLYKGHPVPAEIGNLSRFLYKYGRRAQPYAATLIGLERQSEDGPVYAYEALSNVGGKEVMAFFAECLPKLDAELEAQGLAQNPSRWLPLELEKLPKDQKAQSLILADRSCRFWFDREAGRTFPDTVSRLDWWAANKEKTEEQWLRENLPGTAEAADKGDIIAQNLLQWDVPDMPRDPSAPLWMPEAQVTTVFTNEAVSPNLSLSREAWLESNEKRLHFDPEHECLRLR